MTVFWSIVGGMTLVTIGLLVRPLLWPRALREGGPVDSTRLNVAVYQDQLAELERDLESGVIDADQFTGAREDLQRSLVESNPAATPAPQAVRKASAPAAALAIAIIVPVLALPIYLWLGAGEAGITGRAPPAQALPHGAEGDMPAQVQEMVASLRARLQANPDDLNGWLLLARSYHAIEQYPEAAGAYGQAVRLGAGGDPDVLAAFADAIAGAQGGRFHGQSTEMLERALEIDPEHPRALWLSGVTAYQNREYKASRGYLERLLAVLPPGSEDHRTLQEQIAELDTLIGE